MREASDVDARRAARRRRERQTQKRRSRRVPPSEQHAGTAASGHEVVRMRARSLLRRRPPRRPERRPSCHTTAIVVSGVDPGAIRHRGDAPDCGAWPRTQFGTREREIPLLYSRKVTHYHLQTGTGWERNRGVLPLGKSGGARFAAQRVRTTEVSLWRSGMVQ